MPKEQSYLTATGKIRYNMTNDYMFRAILQKNPKVLKGLISSLLHLQPEQIKSLIIENPIILGEAIDTKELILDIRVRLNDNTLINLEMQIANEHNWTDRSLFYLCRTFNQLEKGHNYSDVLPVIHIGFLDFPVFPEHLEFYSTYKLLNTKNYHLYSDKLTLGVVNLTCIDLATEEDKASRIDHWAKIFKATTWEELRMLAKDDEYMNEATQTLYEFNSDKMIQERCRDREMIAFFDTMTKNKLQQLTDENARMAAEIADLKAQLAEKETK